MRSRNEWAGYLGMLGRGARAGDDAAETAARFADEAGNRLPTDSLLISRVLGVAASRDGSGWRERELSADRLSAEGLWRLAAAGEATAPGLPGEPPLLAREGFGSIEAWSESLLSGLHALGWVDRASGGALWSRITGELDWIAEHLEPDNATRHPWGVHLFVEHALRGRDDAMLYAEELVHVCLVATGRPSARSAWILRDAAEYLASC